MMREVQYAVWRIWRFVVEYRLRALVEEYRFDRGVVTALADLPPGCWQRIDGLRCEPQIIDTCVRKSPRWIRRRLRTLVANGIVERQWAGTTFRPRSMRTYRLVQGDSH